MFRCPLPEADQAELTSFKAYMLRSLKQAMPQQLRGLKILVLAEPTAKRFTEGQLKPAADKVAVNAKPMADKFNNEQLLPAADKIAQNAKPTAERLANQQIKPAAQKLSEQAVPRTKDFTEGVLQPGAKKLADNAEPLGDKLIKEGVMPLADVSVAPIQCVLFACPFGVLCVGCILFV